MVIFRVGIIHKTTGTERRTEREEGWTSRCPGESPVEKLVKSLLHQKVSLGPH